ncbi:YkgJ family cysteine cluster protein [Burkholderia multivorans]|uniref:YkgJ family cysteine cluster protein n=1 Tax=Burkholderia multivorans TaxID=87883 RepID=UPI001C23A810|nr:YkgJ family cysteine cluster protein [Burkholderia multivorans]MBU9212041.1 YkgJ family cysteine cluster protein [Burkholderia multivorans]
MTEDDLPEPVRPLFAAYVQRELPAARTALGGNQAKPVRPRIVTVYRRMDTAISEANAEVACHEGCDYCCHYQVMATPAEVFALAEHIGQMPQARRAALRERIRTYNDRTASMSTHEHVHTNVPCALLEDHRCSAYEYRPSACRGHHSLDASVCKRTFDEPSLNELSPRDAEREAIRYAFSTVLYFAQSAAHVDSEHVELHRALEAALSSGTPLKRWRKGKSPFALSNVERG